MDGKLVVGMNIHREICALQMIGGVAILPEMVSAGCLSIIAMFSKGDRFTTMICGDGCHSLYPFVAFFTLGLLLCL